MINDLEEIFKRFSSDLDLNTEVKYLKEEKKEYIKNTLFFVIISNSIFFIFLSLPITTTLKLITINSLMIFSLFFIFFKILIDSISVEEFFLSKILQVIQNQRDLNKEEFIEFLKLIDKYEKDLFKNNISTKRLRKSTLKYIEEHFDLQEESIGQYINNSQERKKHKYKNKLTTSDYSKEFIYKYLIEKRFYKKDEKVEKYLEEFLLETLNNNIFSMEEVVNIYISNIKDYNIIEIIEKSDIYTDIELDIEHIISFKGGSNSAKL